VNRRSGISILDIVILILIVGVIAALVIPSTRMQKKEQAVVDCHEQQLAISEAMMRFFSTAGDTSLLNISKEPEPDTLAADSSGKTSEEIAEEETEEDTTRIIRVFTEDTVLLRPYLAEKFSFSCPLDGDDYIVIARDSIFYSISCQNDGHGQVIKGRATWEE